MNHFRVFRKQRIPAIIMSERNFVVIKFLIYFQFKYFTQRYLDLNYLEYYLDLKFWFVFTFYAAAPVMWEIHTMLLAVRLNLRFTINLFLSYNLLDLFVKSICLYFNFSAV